MPPTDPAASAGLPTALIYLIVALVGPAGLVVQFVLKRRADRKDKAEAEAKAARAEQREKAAQQAQEEQTRRDRRLAVLEKRVTRLRLTSASQAGDIRGFGAQMADLGAAIRELRTAILNRNSAPGGE